MLCVKLPSAAWCYIIWQQCLVQEIKHYNSTWLRFSPVHVQLVDVTSDGREGSEYGIYLLQLRFRPVYEVLEVVPSDPDLRLFQQTHLLVERRKEESDSNQLFVAAPLNLQKISCKMKHNYTQFTERVLYTRIWP